MPDTASFDVLVIGAGPAGLAAALAATTAGTSIGIVDENGTPGGQIYRASGGSPHPKVRGQIEELECKDVNVMGNTTIIDAPEPGVVLGLTGSSVRRIGYKKLILATGARELFIPFPGWTLPNVMGVGGLQALVKAGLDVRGKQIVVAGSGPLLIAVGAYLKDHGAKIVTVAEQASWASLARFLLHLCPLPQKAMQGATLAAQVGASYRPGTWVEKAEGKDKLESVKLNKFNVMIPCDYLACAYGFAPNIELPMLLGCDIEGGCVKVDELQRTSVPNVFCAGEPTGIGGLELSTVEGLIAGFTATDWSRAAKGLSKDRQKWQSFAQTLDRTFELRDEIKVLAKPETIVCRCEDVKLEQLSECDSAKSAKIHTRCGMGPCQGRICGSATRFLFGWEHGTVRPPLVPTPLSGLEIKD